MKRSFERPLGAFLLTDPNLGNVPKSFLSLEPRKMENKVYNFAEHFLKAAREPTGTFFVKSGQSYSFLLFIK